MPDTIDSVERARVLVEELGAALPAIPKVRARATSDGWIPILTEQHSVHVAAEDAAVRFLLDAVDWDAELLHELADIGELSLYASNIAGFAWAIADSAKRDPNEPDDTCQTLAGTLAYWALAGEPIRPDHWRACDVVAAIEVLPFEAARMRAEAEAPDAHPLFRYPRDIAEARLLLLMLEPTMPDRRAAR